MATVAAGQEPTLEESAARVSDQIEQPQAKRGRGRPRKGGADAALRQGFEVTFDLRTIELLDAATDNRSDYVETLVLARLTRKPVRSNWRRSWKHAATHSRR